MSTQRSGGEFENEPPKQEPIAPVESMPGVKEVVAPPESAMPDELQEVVEPTPEPHGTDVDLSDSIERDQKIQETSSKVLTVEPALELPGIDAGLADSIERDQEMLVAIDKVLLGSLQRAQSASDDQDLVDALDRELVDALNIVYKKALTFEILFEKRNQLKQQIAENRKEVAEQLAQQQLADRQLYGKSAASAAGIMSGIALLTLGTIELNWGLLLTLPGLLLLSFSVGSWFRQGRGAGTPGSQKEEADEDQPNKDGQGGE